jgi:formylmethanofuran dehydrogenase subunit B
LSTQSLVCTGCGCLCDDIKAEVSSDRLAHIENACAKGAAYLSAAFNVERRAESLIQGQQRPVGEAIDEAKRLLGKAKRPLIFGLDGSTCRAQQTAIHLARERRAAIDDVSSSSYGSLIQRILSGELPTCSLSEVKDKADVLIYWGSDPPNTHPRHLSTHTYYAYTNYNPAGWYPKVTLSCVEVRTTELTAMSNAVFKIKPGQDAAFITAILDSEQSTTGEADRFLQMVRKSRFCVVFCGAGLISSLDGDLDLFSRMIKSLQQLTKIAVMPMVPEANLRGFTQMLYQETGYVNQVGFLDGISHGDEFSVHEQLTKGIPDCVVLVDADPFYVLPHSVIPGLQTAEVIYMGRFKTPVARLADVVIPTALPGIEQDGSFVRMDGQIVDLPFLRESPFPTDEAVLSQLMEAL